MQQFYNDTITFTILAAAQPDAIAMKKSIASIQSEGDLEVVLIHEAHGALAEIIGPGLYSIGGSPPEQSAQFHNDWSFNLFLILLVEFFSEGKRSALIDEQYKNLSLMSGLRWFCSTHPVESESTGLSRALATLESWIDTEVPVRFWCPDVDTNIELILSRRQLVNFGANTAKHHLLRLSDLVEKLHSLCVNAGHDFSAQQMAPILACMTEETRNRLNYHSTYILELLGNVFLALNTLIRKRFAENPTNRVSEMRHPDSITSDVFRNLYGDVLVFKRYEEDRIRNHTPVTTQYLKLRY